jgi:hypothetical protein
LTTTTVPTFSPFFSFFFFSLFIIIIILIIVVVVVVLDVRWYVCGTLLNGTKGVCFEDYVVPGETLYYGTGWKHETQNLETPTMTITDTVGGVMVGVMVGVMRPQP